MHACMYDKHCGIGKQHGCGDGSKTHQKHIKNHQEPSKAMIPNSFERQTSISKTMAALGMPGQSSLPAASVGRMAPRRERPPESEKNHGFAEIMMFIYALICIIYINILI